MAESWSRDHSAHLSLVRLDTGQVFPAQFSYHGPDTDIRCAVDTAHLSLEKGLRGKI